MAAPSPPDDADDAVREHADLVYRVALRVLRNEGDAADAAQEALVKVWRHVAGVPAARRRAWCARVARNAALDAVRRRKVRPQPARDMVLPEPRASTPLPDADAEGAEFRGHLDVALDGLGEPYRSVVVLREVEGLSYQEVADALDLPLNTMKVYLHRAKGRLRTALRQSAPELVP
jgi:RNA polymerase sigma-70 factor (ECF subfamily)